MGDRRFTPKLKNFNFKASSTPNNLNVTTRNPVGSGTRKANSTTNNELNRQRNLNSTIITGPRRLNLDVTVLAPTTDWELKCDFASNEHLQALAKREMLEKTVTKHEQTINDQLTLQTTNLYKIKISCQQVNEEISTTEKLLKIKEMVKVLEDNLETCRQLFNEFNIQECLDNFIIILNLACNHLSVENIKSINTQEDYNKLIQVIKKCVKITEIIKSSNREFDNIYKLANYLKTFTELQTKFKDKYTNLVNLRTEATYLFLKNTSDMFAATHKMYS